MRIEATRDDDTPHRRLYIAYNGEKVAVATTAQAAVQKARKSLKRRKRMWWSC